MWADALPNLLIGLREGLEAGLVVSILLAALRKHSTEGHRASSTPIWLGVIAAIILALSFGAVLTFYRSVLSTTGQEALSGTLSVIAVCLVTWMVFWMRRTARGLAGELRAQVDQALRVSTAALALTAFLAVGREGVETALFLWTAGQATGHTVAPLIGAAIGIACAVVLCVLLYYRAVHIRLDKFFNRTAILLIIIAGGVFAEGLGDLQEAGWLPGHLWVAFDLSAHIDPSSWWMSIITGVTELSPTMTWLQVVMYVGYLAIVITLFVREGRRAVVAPPKATAPAKAGAEETGAEEKAATTTTETPETADPPKQPSRRRIAVVTGAAFVVPPVVAGCLIGFAPGAATSGQEIKVTGTSCAQGWTGARAGRQSFTVVNSSKSAAEINLIQTASQGIVAEIETLGPGTQQTLAATLASGTYAWRCLISGQPTTLSAAVAVTGDSTVAAPAAVKPVTVAELQPALNAYNSYVSGKLGVLEGQVAKLQGDLKSGNLAAARTDWLPADLTWEQVGEEPYGSFGDFGVKIDAGPQGFEGGVNDTQFTGLHRIEYGLWNGQSASTLLPFANGLATNVAALKAQLAQLDNDPTNLPIRAHEILEDALRDHLTGASDQGAGAGYAETLADVQVDRVVLGELASLITARAPSLSATVNGQLDTLQTALLATRDNGQWTSVASTPLAARQKVDAAIGAVLETLSAVPDLLETPAH